MRVQIKDEDGVAELVRVQIKDGVQIRSLTTSATRTVLTELNTSSSHCPALGQALQMEISVIAPFPGNKETDVLATTAQLLLLLLVQLTWLDDVVARETRGAEDDYCAIENNNYLPVRLAPFSGPSKKLSQPTAEFGSSMGPAHPCLASVGFEDRFASLVPMAIRRLYNLMSLLC